MPRLPRCDRPGRWHHVYNRGIARRPVFETRADIRYFLSCLVRASRRGELELHAYCILTTHFHLLVRSPAGQLSKAMDRVLNAYVRYYNRTRRRDGSLFRGRYGARPVDSLAYRRVVLRYIDRNAVQARLAAEPWAYIYGSAWHYVRPRRPRWLTTDWVDSEVRRRGHEEPWSGYAAAFGQPWMNSEEALVRRRLQTPVDREDPLDDLIDAAPTAVLDWMRRNAALADGRALAQPCVAGATVLEVLGEAIERTPRLTYRTPKGRERDAWPVVSAYLLRALAALRWTEVGEHLGVSSSNAARRARTGRLLVGTDQVIGEAVGNLAAEILDRSHGARAIGGA